MRSKREMYINYERSNKKRRRRDNSKVGKVIITVIAILALSFLACYAIYIQIDNSAFQGTPNQSDLVTELNQAFPTPVISELKDQADPNETVVHNNQITPILTPIPDSQPNDDTFEETAEDLRTPTKVKGIYVTAPAAGSNRMIELTELAKTTEINAMVIDIKDDYGKVSYRMESDIVKEMDAATNMIPNIENQIASLKEENIYLIARIVAFKDPHLANKRPDLAIQYKDGSLFRDKKGDSWLNPYKTEVWDYLMELAEQAVAIGFDEIQFDYIRFSTDKGIEKAAFGKEAENKTKEEIITEFTKYVYENLKPMGVFVSADVYGTIISSQVDAGLVGQNYIEMSKYLDYICPMIYPSHFGNGNYGVDYPDLEPYTIIKKSLTASKMKLSEIAEGEHRAIVRPWLQDFTATWITPHLLYGGEELREQMNGVYDAGYQEWILWNSSCKYSVTGLKEETQ